jgi:hypothetical protein
LKDAKLPLEPGIKMDTLPEDATAFGIDSDKELCLGFMDNAYCIAPGATVLQSVHDDWLYRLFTAAKRNWDMDVEGTDPADLISDTGELSWNPADGFFTINTDRTQGAVGFIGGKDISLNNLDIAVQTNHCSVLITSVDDKPISESRRLLITAVARSENTDQFRTADRTTVPPEGRGHAPVLVEPVAGNVTISTDIPCIHANVKPLDAAGKPKGEISVDLEQGKLNFGLGKQHSTVYYAIELVE